MDFWFNTVCINLDVGIFSHLQLQRMTYCATLYPSIKKYFQLVPNRLPGVLTNYNLLVKKTISDKTFGLKRTLLENVDECSPKRSLSSGCSPGEKMTSARSTLPSPLQLPDNISDDIIDILKNKPFHPKFYQARVTLVKKAREFFAGFCPYPSTQEYETMVLCIGKSFPHLSDPGVKESDPPRIKYVSFSVIFYSVSVFHGRVDTF